MDAIDRLMLLGNKVMRIEENNSMGLLALKDYENMTDDVNLKLIKFINHIEQPSAVVYLWNTKQFDDHQLTEVSETQKMEFNQIKRQAQYLFKTGEIETILLFLEEQLNEYPQYRNDIYMQFGRFKVVEKLFANKKLSTAEYLTKISQQLRAIDNFVRKL